MKELNNFREFFFDLKFSEWGNPIFILFIFLKYEKLRNELKHLSNYRKINQNEIFLVAASEKKIVLYF